LQKYFFAEKYENSFYFPETRFFIIFVDKSQIPNLNKLMSNFKSRKADTYTLKEAIETFLKVSPIKNQYQENALVSAWSEIMGVPIAEKTTQIYIKDKTLFVRISSAPLRSELQMSKIKILQLYAQKFDTTSLKDIVFL
jgi:mRNA-degrading endonuclease YafQ of YafQ-DinJ toxin-antitoxin module